MYGGVIAAKVPLTGEETRLKKAAILLCKYAGAEAVRRAAHAVHMQDPEMGEEAQETLDAVDALHETVTGRPMFVG